ncbi:MAG TPA: hypothetical protein VFZ52_04250 [Chryseolinea sp.]
MKNIYILAILVLCFLQTYGQELPLDQASDPVSMATRLTADLESYSFENGSIFYSIRPGFYYGLRNNKHLMGMSIPFMHNVFEGNYAGFENTTGFGDLKISYLFVPYQKEGVIGIERATFSFDVTAPTGEYLLGRGAGAWLYKPGIIVKWRIAESIAFYPEVRFQFSGEEANSGGGSDGAPDAEDPEKDDEVQNLSLSFPATVNIESWNGWFSLNALYTRSFTEKTDFLFLRMDLGKVIGRKSCTSLRITKFIAGQPRLDLVIQANFTFFMR